ncbi:MAG TPA: S28 family serine protease [Methanocorpusculum sp.]|nr:S28 family serine protease [Methanocorpusculum sp.]
MNKLILCGIFIILLLTASASSGCINDTRTLEEKLTGLDNVISVEKLNSNGAEKYLVTYSVPLDWNNPSLGSMPLRVEIMPREGGSEYTVVQTEGYILQDAALKSDEPCELASVLGANYVHIEHRFFGGSAPEDFSYDDTKYWEYLTAENFAKDQHMIITGLKNIFPGKYVITGSSKGGLDAALFMYYYPQDVALTVAYSAPCCVDFNDKRMMPYVYREAGNMLYSEEEAANYRRMITEFQEFCMVHRDVLAPKYYETALAEGCTLRESCTADTLFDVAVLDVAIETWQSRHSLEDFRTFLAMPENTKSALDAKISAAFSILHAIEPTERWSASSPYYPYFYQTAHEIGLYYYDFSYIRDALQIDGLKAEVSVTREEEENLIAHIMLTEEQNALVSYDPKTIEGFRKWISVTDSKFILIYGAGDPWYSVKIPKNPGNPNVVEYVSSNQSHQVSIENGFDEETKKQIIADIYAALA